MSEPWITITFLIILLGLMAYGVVWTILDCLFTAKDKRRRARKRAQELEWQRVRSLIDKVDQWKAEGYKLTPEQSELVEHFRAAATARKRRLWL